MFTYARMGRLQDAQRRLEASQEGQKLTFDTCVQCGHGVEIPLGKEEAALYACRHRNGETLCQACYEDWILRVTDVGMGDKWIP